MSVWRLIAKEIAYRKLSFAVGVLSVMVAVGCLVAELTLLDGHDVRTEQIIAGKIGQTQRRVDEQKRQVERRVRKLQVDVRARVAELQDDMRKIMKGLGFNVLILPEGQNVSEVYSQGFASKTMPEHYVDKLANSRLVTINHLLPSLTQKIAWREQQRTIILIGTRGEVPIAYRDPKRPLVDPVERGHAVVGYELHRSLKLNVGDKIRLMGQEFAVSKLHPQRGTKDDITVWINLAEAQTLLKRKGLINAILALECFCSGSAVGKIRDEIERILPGTQVIEKSGQALARAEARSRAAIEAKQALARAKVEAGEAVQRAVADGRLAIQHERDNRDELRDELLGFAKWVIPSVLVACVAWVGLLTFANVRERAGEIGILRAIGVRSTSIFQVFLAKAMIVGFLGACLGYAAGFALGARWAEAGGASGLFDPLLAVGVVVLAPLLAGLAGWAPALIAAQKDPAVILREG
jgi:putative ABC transport system permease protein